jgi:hypothetical protein
MTPGRDFPGADIEPRESADAVMIAVEPSLRAAALRLDFRPQCLHDVYTTTTLYRLG